PRRHRRRVRARPALGGLGLRRPRRAARPLDAARGARAVRRLGAGPRGAGQRGRRPLPERGDRRAGRIRRRRHRLGAAPLLRAPVSRPRIGICAYRTHARWTHWELEATVIPQGYVEGVRLAGGVPILLPPTPDGADDPGEVLDGIDGLTLPGGPDLAPALYGAELHEGTDEPTPERRVRDAFELALLRCARERSLPVLGICRGVQLMNVERGGTLVQDLGEGELDLAPHRPQLGTFGRHRVATEAGTAAAGALGPFVD